MDRLRVALLLTLLVGAAGAAGAQGLHRGTLVLDGTHRLERVEGHVLQLGGHASVGPDARIGGTVVLLADALEVEGTIAGDVFLLGGTLSLAESARIEGGLVAAGGDLQAARGAEIAGGVTHDLEVAAELVRPTPTIAQRAVRSLVQMIAVALLAYVLARTMPRAIDRTGDAIVEHPLVSLATGMLAAAVGLVLLIAMAFTLVLIPLALFGAVVFGASVAYGWVAVGRRIARRWPGSATPVATAVATAAFVLVLNGVGLIPWIGAPAGLLASVGALGGVVITGFGRRRFVPDPLSRDG